MTDLNNYIDFSGKDMPPDEKIIKRYPWRKLVDEYCNMRFNQRYSANKLLTCTHLKHFGMYLEEKEILFPHKWDLINYIVLTSPDVDDMEYVIPALCSFIIYCEEKKDSLFGGVFKGLYIERKLTVRDYDLFGRDIYRVSSDEYGREGMKTYTGETEEFIDD